MRTELYARLGVAVAKYMSGLIVAITCGFARGPAPLAAPLLAAEGWRRATPAIARVSRRAANPEQFDVRVDLGDESGVVEHAFPPYFSRSALVTLRVPLPFDLHADPVQGCYRVMQDGSGLREGDVLRAFSTPRLRYDSDRGEVRVGLGLPGRLAAGSDSQSSSSGPKWLSILQSNFNPLTAFSPRRAQTCLFIADGQPHSRVTDALVANEAGKVRDLVLIMERPDAPP